MPYLPGTRWIDELSGGDPALALAFMAALQSGATIETALDTAFGPDRIASVTGQADYFGWLAMVSDPLDQVTPALRRIGDSTDTTLLAPLRGRNILNSLDQNGDPWASPELVYARAIPWMTRLTVGENWAVATADLGDNWIAIHFFRRQENRWLAVDLEDALMDETFVADQGPYSITDGPITLTYWSWDEPLLDQVKTVLVTSVHATVANFDLDTPAITFSLIPIDNPLGTPFEPEEGVVPIVSPAWMTDSTTEYAFFPVLVSSTAVWSLIEREIQPAERVRGYGMLVELILWQGDQIADEFDYMRPSSLYELTGGWTAPPTATGPGWRDLDEIWVPYDSLSGEDLEPWIYSRLVVQYILDQYGPARLPDMLDGFSSSDSLDDWLTAATGQSRDQFEPAWREWVVDHYY